MSEDDPDEIDEIIAQRKPSPQADEIARIMSAEGVSYFEAHQRVMYPSKPSEPEPQPQPEPRKQLSIENLFSMVDNFNAETESVERAKQELAQFKRKIDERDSKSKETSDILAQMKFNLREKQRVFEAKEAALREQLQGLDARTAAFSREVFRFEAEKEKEKAKKRSYVKKISDSAISEFESE